MHFPVRQQSAHLLQPDTCIIRPIGTTAPEYISLITAREIKQPKRITNLNHSFFSKASHSGVMQVNLNQMANIHIFLHTTKIRRNSQK